MTKCEVCEKAEGFAVVSVPGVPYSASYCQECLDANAHPWGILVANTAICGGLDKMHEAWVEMVDQTCKRLDKTRDEFNFEVERVEQEMPEF